MSNEHPIHRRCAVLTALAAVVLVTGCASQATFRFDCEREVNGGLLLTIDVVQIDDREEQEIRQAGDQWFYSDLRRQLGARVKTVAVEGGCRETVSVAPIKGYDRVAIIADYQFEGQGGTKVQMEFRGKQDWRGKTLSVRVRDRYLTLARSS